MQQWISSKELEFKGETPDSILDGKMSAAEKKRWQCRMAAAMVFTAIITYLAFGVIWGIGYVKGISMQPYLQPGDIFFFSRMGGYCAGDVALIKQRTEDDYIKRIVACPGQTVDFDPENGAFVVDGTEYSEPYVYKENYVVAGVDYPLVLSENEYYLLGDNRTNSMDSRSFGPVKTGELEGKVIAIVRLK